MIYTAREANKEYEFASILSDVQLYERYHEEEFNNIGKEIKHLSYLGQNQYNFFRTFYIKDETNEKELYKRVLQLAGYSVTITLPDNIKLKENVCYAQYIVNIKW